MCVKILMKITVAAAVQLYCSKQTIFAVERNPRKLTAHDSFYSVFD